MWCCFYLHCCWISKCFVSETHEIKDLSEWLGLTKVQLKFRGHSWLLTWKEKSACQKRWEPGLTGFILSAGEGDHVGLWVHPDTKYGVYALLSLSAFTFSSLLFHWMWSRPAFALLWPVCYCVLFRILGILGMPFVRNWVFNCSVISVLAVHLVHRSLTIPTNPHSYLFTTFYSTRLWIPKVRTVCVLVASPSVLGYQVLWRVFWMMEWIALNFMQSLLSAA